MVFLRGVGLCEVSKKVKKSEIEPFATSFRKLQGFGGDCVEGVWCD